jgi:hypothetical protein
MKQLIVNNHLIFPTVVSETLHTVTDKEKDCWFDLYLKNSNNEGRSQDFIGFENIQNETIFNDLLMNKLKISINEYFKCLNINADTLDVHLTKCFFNVTNQSGIDVHDHSENHISFTYYPFIANGKDRDIMIYNFNEAHANEPYAHFFSNYITEWTSINSNIISFPITEGSLFIFPSKLKHCIEERQGDKYEEGKTFTNKESLQQSRFCVAGDMLYTKKENINSYNRALSNPKNWRII